MTQVLVFVPTNRYGGLDILFSSLKRQNYQFVLAMADEYVNERIHIYDSHDMLENSIFVECIRQPGDARALAQAYNNAADLAISMEFDLMVSLQDYIWVPENGIELFVEVHKEHPNALLTGLVSLSEAPSDHAISDPEGLYTIFNEPLTGRPEGISWHDVRATDLYPGSEEIVACTTTHWEANWAAIPVELFRKGARWDLEYDAGIAYENQDFANFCEKQFGTPCILDKRNLAIGVPHRQIWPQEEKDLERYNNRWLHEEKWGKF